MTKIIKIIKLIRSINFFQFIYLNYFCKNVIRLDNHKIIPYKNTVIDISPTSKIILSKGDIEVGTNLLRKSKAETRIKISDNAIWCSNGGCDVSYESFINVLPSAVFCTRFFTINSNSAIVAAKKINIDHDVMIGRNVLIYDSDFHTIKDVENQIINSSKEVTIEDHTWIASNSTILKGVTIGYNSIISACSLVIHNIPKNTIYKIDNHQTLLEDYGYWLRKRP